MATVKFTFEDKNIPPKTVENIDEGFTLLEAAEEIGLYKPVDYAKYPAQYCGMAIRSTPYIFN